MQSSGTPITKRSRPARTAALALAVAACVASASQAATLVWTGATAAPNNGTTTVYPTNAAVWDLNTSNWAATDNTATKYAVGDDVIFTDGNVTNTLVAVASAAQSPLNVTFSHVAGGTAKNYVFLRSSTSASAGLNTAAGYTYSSSSPFGLTSVAAPATSFNGTLTLDTGFLGTVALEARAASGTTGTIGGNTIIRSGTLEIRDALALPGSNPNQPTVTLDGGRFAININTNGATAPGSSNLAGALTVSSDSTLANTSSNVVGNFYNGAVNIAAGKTLTVETGSGITFRGNLAGSANTAVVSLGTSNGQFRVGGTAQTGVNLVTFDLGTGTAFLNNGGSAATQTISLGALTGGANTQLRGSDQNPATVGAATYASVYSIGSINTSTTFDGKVVDGQLGPSSPSQATNLGAFGTTAITKVGTGSLTLTNANTYTGATNVNAGKLIVNGSSVSATNVASGATLGGGGTINNAVTVASGGTLSPGNSIGTLSDAATTLAGTLLAEYDGTGAGSIDRLNVSGLLDLTGSTLTLSQIGTAADDAAYVLASYGSLNANGTFGTVNNLPSGYAINYAYNGNNIALVVASAPEPASLAALVGVGGVLLRRRRRTA